MDSSRVQIKRIVLSSEDLGCSLLRCKVQGFQLTYPNTGKVDLSLSPSKPLKGPEACPSFVEILFFFFSIQYVRVKYNRWVYVCKVKLL